MLARLSMLVALASLWLPCHTVAAAELNTLEGRHIRIITDLPLDATRRQWTACFDAAVPQWITAWNLPASRAANFHITTYVMSEKAPFQQRGMLPAALPDFPHGYQMGNETWVLQQPSPYYTRHLILHEGVHALAWHLFRGAGPTWFMEGTAEWLATHRGTGTDCHVGIFPASRDEVPYWGRFKVIAERREQHKIPSLVSVLRYNEAVIQQVEPYAWSWAAVQLFAMQPETSNKLVTQAASGSDRSPQFTRDFVTRLGDQWPIAKARWRILTSELDYGFDASRNTLALSVQDPRWDGRTLTRDIRADHGWQSVGVLLRPGQTVNITATGSVTLAQNPKPWRSEPDGITIRYHQHQPLGRLIATLLPTAPGDEETTAPLDVRPVGPSAQLDVDQWSWLLLRVNDAQGELSDNQGSYQVEISAASPPDGLPNP